MTSVVLNNFFRGKVDKDLSGRFDLPIFQNGFPLLRNFISCNKGSLKYRTGFIYEAETRNNEPAVLIPFRFNTNQTYLLELTNGYMRFYTYDNNGKFGYVTSSGSDVLVLQTDITYEQAKNLAYAQNADAMYFAEGTMNPKVLKRTSANSFTIENAPITGIDFNDTGYPSSVTFYQGRLWFGGFSNKPTTVKASGVADYGQFTIPSSNIKDDDPLSYQLSIISDPILWLYGGRYNLVAGCGEGVVAINGGNSGDAITSTKVNAEIISRESACSTVPTEKDSQMVYLSLSRTKAYSLVYDMLSESFLAANLSVLNEESGKIKKLYYKRDKNNLIYGLMESGQMTALLYSKSEDMFGWFPITTKGEVKSFCPITRPDGNDDLIICVLRNGTYYIERMADEVDFTDFYETDYENDTDKAKFYRLQGEELKQCVYVDNAVTIKNLHTEEITLSGTTLTSSSEVFNSSFVGHRIIYKTQDGSQYGEMLIKSVESSTSATVEVLTEEVYPLTWNSWYLTFNKVDDLDDIEGQEQAVIGDGGFAGVYTVENGEIQLDKEYSVVTLGYSYKGFAMSFILGMYDNGLNSQTIKKKINTFVLRFVSSAGVRIGTDVNNMQDVQLFNPSGYYDAPPLLMDGDEYVYGYNDTHDYEKRIFVEQEKPLPCNLTVIEARVSFDKL